MSRTVTYVEVPPDDVFSVLTDAQTYAYWVVGCKDIRAVEPEWPAAGAGFHHTVGVGPLATRDETRIIEIDRPNRLTLRARAWPAGEARVTLIVERAGTGSRIVMEEEPVAGPAKAVHNPLLDAAAHARNTVALRRLSRLARER